MSNDSSLQDPAFDPLGSSVSIGDKITAIVNRPVMEFPGYVRLAQGLGIPPEAIAAMKVGEMLAHSAVLQAMKGNTRILNEYMKAPGARPAPPSPPVPLPAAPVYLNREQLAARLSPPVKPRTVANWIQRGLPKAHRVGRRQLYELRECQKWVNENLQRVHGGYHPSPAEAKFDPAPAAIEAPPLEPATLFATIKSPDDIMQYLRDDKMTPVSARMLQETFKAAAAYAELEKMMGKLCDVVDVRQTWAQALQVLRSTIDSLPSRLVAHVLTSVPLPRESETKLRGVIKEELGRVLGELATTSF